MPACVLQPAIRSFPISVAPKQGLQWPNLPVLEPQYISIYLSIYLSSLHISRSSASSKKTNPTQPKFLWNLGPSQGLSSSLRCQKLRDSTGLLTLHLVQCSKAVQTNKQLLSSSGEGFLEHNTCHVSGGERGPALCLCWQHVSRKIFSVLALLPQKEQHCVSHQVPSWWGGVGMRWNEASCCHAGMGRENCPEKLVLFLSLQVPSSLPASSKHSWLFTQLSTGSQCLRAWLSCCHLLWVEDNMAKWGTP